MKEPHTHTIIRFKVAIAGIISLLKQECIIHYVLLVIASQYNAEWCR